MRFILGNVALLHLLHLLVEDALGNLQSLGAQFLQSVGAVVDQRLDDHHEDVGGAAGAPLYPLGDGVEGVKLGEADGDQQVLGEDETQRRGDILAIARLLMRRHRNRNGEDTVLILQPAGEFDFLQLFARRNIQLIIGASLADLLIGGIVKVHPDRLAAGLMFCQHAPNLPRTSLPLAS